MKDGLVSADGTVTCQDCGRVSKNMHGHTLHWTLVHGKGRTGKNAAGKGKAKQAKASKKSVDYLAKARNLVNTPSDKCTLEVPGQIGGQNFIFTVDLSIAATAIRPV